MQPLEEETTFVSPDECAHEVLEVVPLVMRVIRAEMRSRRASDLSVPQFRTLAFLSRCEGASLSDVAEHIGLTLPSASKMVDGLVVRELVTRRSSARDRRRVLLALTAKGEGALASARRGTQARLAEMLTALPAEERAVVVRALRTLRRVFAAGQGKNPPASG
jgi:DNA-binding MarR family transcriptional regulator